MKTKLSKRFNLRVYGILRNHSGQVLISDERRGDFCFTKFPGGGLEWGEGIHDCLHREFQEELGVEIHIGQLVYVTDFFQQSAFNQQDQLIAMYYEVEAPALMNRDFPSYEVPLREEGELFRWMDVEQLECTFPIDRHVVKNYLQKPK